MGVVLDCPGAVAGHAGRGRGVVGGSWGAGGRCGARLSLGSGVRCSLHGVVPVSRRLARGPSRACWAWRAGCGRGGHAGLGGRVGREHAGAGGGAAGDWSAGPVSSAWSAARSWSMAGRVGIPRPECVVAGGAGGRCGVVAGSRGRRCGSGSCAWAELVTRVDAGGARLGFVTLVLRARSVGRGAGAGAGVDRGGRDGQGAAAGAGGRDGAAGHAGRISGVVGG